MRAALAFSVLVGLLAGGAWLYLQQAEPAHVALFRDEVPRWYYARLGGEPPTADPIASAAGWPDVAAALQALEAAGADVDQVQAAAIKLNQASRASGLPYWVDVQSSRDRPLLLTYAIEDRVTYQGPKVVEVLHARRLDRMNIITGWLGHAGGEQPVVLVDRIEENLLSELRSLADLEHQSDVDRRALGAWQRILEDEVGAGRLAEAAAVVRARDEQLDTMEGRLHGGSVRVSRPRGLILGDQYFDDLEPYTSVERGRAPLLLRGDLERLQKLDRSLRRGDLQTALKAAVDAEVKVVRAHELHHAVDPDPGQGVLPAALLEYVGDDDMSFAAAADAELRAYLGQIHDAEVPACFALCRLVRTAAGGRARAVPHHYASVTVLRALSDKPLERRSDFGPVFDELCALPDGELRARAAKAYRRLYEADLPPVSRSAAQ